MKFVLRRVNPFSVLRSSKTWQQAFVTWLTWKFIVNYAKITSSEMQSKMGSGHLDKNEDIICICVARLEDGTYFLFLENSKSFEMGLFWLGFSVFGVTSFFCNYIWISQCLSLLSHCSHWPRGPNFVQNGDPMGTQFWVRWGPPPAEMGTQNAYFWKLIETS